MDPAHPKSWIMLISPSYSFIGGDRGSWELVSMSPVIGEMLEPTPYFEIRNEYLMRVPVDFHWLLRGITSSPRNAAGGSREMTAAQAQLGRPGATCAAFIPVKKKPEWWEMTQEERRGILEAGSGHPENAQDKLPGIARQMHHSRDLGEPFDFLTWFEYEPRDAAAFEDHVARMRSTEEWKYVEREVDVRLVMRG